MLIAYKAIIRRTSNNQIASETEPCSTIAALPEQIDACLSSLEADEYQVETIATVTEEQPE